MIKDLMKLKQQIDTMIETYKDLHPEECNIFSDDAAKVQKINEDYEKQIALKRVREGYYEDAFRKKQRKKTTESSEGSPSLCVYGDS